MKIFKAKNKANNKILVVSENEEDAINYCLEVGHAKKR